jgi:hypothetical protein
MSQHSCGKTHIFRIQTHCEECGVRKDFIVERFCQANNISFIDPDYTFEIKHFKCYKCHADTERSFPMHFYCFSGGRDSDCFRAKDDLRITIIIENIDFTL